MSVQVEVSKVMGTTTTSKHSITMIMGMWLIIGLFIDGFAHNHGAVETFFTPWHAILYSGYLACAGWIFFMIRSNKISNPSTTWISAIPVGYKLGVAGVILFFAGGLGDMYWHTVFGIEKNIEALLSPTHLLLLSGALLILTSPYRAISAAEKGAAPTFRQLLPALTSIGLTFTVFAFFLMYAWSFRQNLWMARDYDAVAKAVVDFMLTTMILVIPVMFVLRRWKLPFGTVTLFFLFESIFLAVLDGFRDYGSIIILLISGVIGDVLFREIKEREVTDWRYKAVFFVLPVLIWGLYFASLKLFHTLHWSPELWGGTIFLCALSSLGLSILAAPVATSQSR
ncbi:hypothetical protein [Paenibacillus qinlingensis]|uniref:Uncharacterized protein n=1 Tax=Paenibacillus qinlingensis TaxID=1837343 RepID=A0ABU1P0I9_9BACL|nr:hypothetical protein [Paenibacillus qinlingensis]MDR6553241.1 hypothetical protein [Paenibacillus qinlingensis]